MLRRSAVLIVRLLFSYYACSKKKDILQIYSLPKRSVCFGGESVHPSPEVKTLILS